MSSSFERDNLQIRHIPLKHINTNVEKIFYKGCFEISISILKYST